MCARAPTIGRLAEDLVAHVGKLLADAATEEELRVGVEGFLAPLLERIGVKTAPRYERAGPSAGTLFRGRPDAVHGLVVIEYERPGAFASERARAHAFEQLTGYMGAEAGGGQDSEALLGRMLGVGFDGRTVFFVRHRAEADGLAGRFASDGPHPFDSEAARTFLAHLRALSRLPLTPETLAERFGPKGGIAPLAVSALVDSLRNWRSERVATFYGEWRRLFGIVYGERFGEKGDGRALAKLYGIEEPPEFQEALFAVHTYFALLMKLIAAEIVALRETSFGDSFSSGLVHASPDGFRARLTDLEEGGIYARNGVANFLEGDFFRWYLDALSPKTAEAVREMARGLTDFEPATTAVSPEVGRDLLKKLYQYVVPQEVRRNLGEYYTPDWLAELLVEETGYDGDARRRVLDPACGSGTFLVLAIHRAREHAARHRESRKETAKRIAANIWGLDLNPLAVIAARTNYLFAMGELASELPSLEIPVYLADSVLWPERAGQFELAPAGDAVQVRTSLQTFFVPGIWVERGELMRAAARMIERMVRDDYSPAEAVKRLKKDGLVFPPHERVVEAFYAELVRLEKEGRNGIWARFLMSIFAPTTAGRFDFVIGNPPWIRWGYLSEEYRKATLGMWQRYGLFSLKGHRTRLGAGEKDFSMLFLYAAADLYLAKGGKLGFLITQEVFKSKGAGEGFRRFRLGDKEHLQVLKAHDLSTVQPFEGAVNKTAMIILRKGRETKYPVPYTVWRRRKGVGKIPTKMKLEEVRRLLEKTALVAQPVDRRTGSWQTVKKGAKGSRRYYGRNAYRARLGARAEPYGVYWVELVQVMSNGDLRVRNMPGKGKREIRRLPPDGERIERDLVFPGLRGADVERWGGTPGILIVMPQDPGTREPYPVSAMQEKWPRTYGYLARFKDVLLSRGSKAVREFARKTAFYAMYGIGPYTVAPYKVVWKRMAGDIVAAVVSQHKTPFGWRPVIPTDTTAFFALEREDEAHYLCGIVNSTPVREFVRSYSSAGRGFGAPAVMEHIRVPQFDAKNELHAAVARASLDLHRLKAAGRPARRAAGSCADARPARRGAGRDAELARREKELDGLVTRLFA